MISFAMQAGGPLSRKGVPGGGNMSTIITEIELHVLTRSDESQTRLVSVQGIIYSHNVYPQRGYEEESAKQRGKQRSQ
jgi:hypothetical protein